jgi:parallel beta-helix repeat protein
LKKIAIGILLTLLLTSVATLAFNIQLGKASGTIYIRADGSVEGTDKIVTADNVTYTFIDSINDSIVVERDNIILDGADYTVQSSGIGIDLPSRTNVTIKNTKIDGSIGGYGGIRLYGSSEISIVGNNITANSWYGIVLYESSNNMLRNNEMVDNGVNFGVVGFTLSDFINDVDTSNTVDGKPIYYWVNKQGTAVPLDAGYVALVNCTGITVQNLNLTKNWQGVILAATINSTISQNNIEKNQGSSTKGLFLWGSSNNTISENNITKSGENGMELYESSNNTIALNNITNNGHYGIYLCESSNNTISGNEVMSTYGYTDSKGIALEKSSDNVIDGNVVVDNDYGGIKVSGSSNNIISANNVTYNGEWGIEVTYWPIWGLFPEYSDNNLITENHVSNNSWGIRLCLSDNNTLTSNVVTNNEKGVQFETSRYNILRDNHLAGNKYNFGVLTFYDEVRLSTYSQDIDSSNVVNGKPIYYSMNQKDLTIDSSDFGYLALINCTDVSVKGVSLTNNIQGLLLAFTINSTIENVTVADNYVGIHIISSDANLITTSNITNNAFGISLYGSSRNKITESTLTNNGYTSGFYYGCVLIGRLVMGEGILETTETVLSEDNIIISNMMSNNGAGIVLTNPGTTRTIIAGNTIKNGDTGIYVAYNASNNRIYHNDFTDNNNHVVIDTAQGAAVNEWDNGYPSGGNYWSNYTGVDAKSGPNQDQPGSDGIGDTLFSFSGANQDRYPLMNPMGSPQPPIALFTYTPEQPVKDQTVTFDASTSGDRDGSITTYKWDFNDGNVTTTMNHIIEHVYTAPGTYTVNLTVTDNDDLTHSTMKSITVTEDLTAPTTLNDYDDLWHTSDFAVTLTATDDLSGVAETYYRINDGPIQNATDNGQPLITTEGADNKLEYWSVDNAGNEENHHTLTGIKLDKTQPTFENLSRTPDGEAQPDQQVTISVNVTDLISQVKNTTLYYSLNNGTTWEEPVPMNLNLSTNLYEATISGQQAGTWVKYKIVAYDFAGNNATLEGTEPYFVYQVVPEFLQSLTLLLFITTTLLAAILCGRKQDHTRKPFEPQ